MESHYFKRRFSSCGSFIFCAHEPPTAAQTFWWHMPVWLARNEGKGSGGCQWPLDHCPCAGVGAAVTGMALEALHFGLTHLGYGLPAPQLVKMKGAFSGTGEVAASLDVVFYYEVLLCSCVLINTHTHIKPSLTVLQ